MSEFTFLKGLSHTAFKFDHESGVQECPNMLLIDEL